MGANPGLAGNANSSQTLNNNTTAQITLSSFASGGGGGDVQGVNGSAGGNATAMTNLTSDASLGSFAGTPDGSGVPLNHGSNIVGGANGFSAGNGGNATATAAGTGTSTVAGNSAVTVEADSFGESGGSVENAVLGNGGAGGIATSTATASGVGLDPVSATVTATGGAGGEGAGTGFQSGNGGNATAQATAHSVQSQSQATASVTGGAGGAATNFSTVGIGGTATASATANGVTATEFQGAGSNGQGGSAFAQTTWTPAAGATVVIGISNVNNGIGTVTGPSALIAGITGTGSLTIGNGATATILRLSTNSGGSAQSALTLKTGSSLDIANNHLFINYGPNPDPISTIAGYLKSGYADGAWNGLGINSSSANSKYGVGYADSADPGNPAGLSADQIEIEYTLYGDANLDGVVSGDDFTILTDNLGKQVNGWDKGDFNYDGVVNGDDFTLLTDNLGKQANGADITLPAADYAAVNAFAAANGFAIPTIAVPEPTSAGLALIAVSGMLARRRHKR